MEPKCDSKEKIWWKVMRFFKVNFFVFLWAEKKQQTTGVVFSPQTQVNPGYGQQALPYGQQAPPYGQPQPQPHTSQAPQPPKAWKRWWECKYCIAFSYWTCHIFKQFGFFIIVSYSSCALPYICTYMCYALIKKSV